MGSWSLAALGRNAPDEHPRLHGESRAGDHIVVEVLTNHVESRLAGGNFPEGADISLGIINLPERCPACGSPWVFLHKCSCGDLPYPHVVCDACDMSFRPETLAMIAKAAKGEQLSRGVRQL